MENHLAKPRMTCQEYIEYLNNNYQFDALFDDMFWTDSFSTDRLWNYVLNYAMMDNVVLTDIVEYGYDNELYELYQNSEKGLS
jgi:hypothetical protein